MTELFHRSPPSALVPQGLVDQETGIQHRAAESLGWPRSGQQHSATSQAHFGKVLTEGYKTGRQVPRLWQLHHHTLTSSLGHRTRQDTHGGIFILVQLEFAKQVDLSIIQYAVQSLCRPGCQEPEDKC